MAITIDEDGNTAQTGTELKKKLWDQMKTIKPDLKKKTNQKNKVISDILKGI